MQALIEALKQVCDARQGFPAISNPFWSEEDSSQPSQTRTWPKHLILFGSLGLPLR
jgi:hypothetical protein